MDILIVYPQNKEQLTALKAVMKAMKISFEQKSGIYPVSVMNGVKQSLRETKEGKVAPFTGIKDMLNT
jgi:hypothetical protein